MKVGKQEDKDKDQAQRKVLDFFFSKKVSFGLESSPKSVIFAVRKTEGLQITAV